MSSKLYNYVKFAFSYGFARKLFYTKDLVEYKEVIYNKTYTSPILFTDKIIFSSWSGIISIYFCPFFILTDIRNIELKLKNFNSIIPAKNKSFNDVLTDNHSFDYEMKEKK